MHVLSHGYAKLRNELLRILRSPDGCLTLQNNLCCRFNVLRLFHVELVTLYEIGEVYLRNRRSVLSLAGNVWFSWEVRQRNEYLLLCPQKFVRFC